MTLKRFIKSSVFIALAVSTTALATSNGLSFNETAKTSQVVRFAQSAHEATVATGTFKGKSRHDTSGDVHILKTEVGYALVLGENFSLDGAPSPILGFGQNGKYIAESAFTDLEVLSGRQVYPLPVGFTPSDFSEVYVWCEDFDIALGVAKLTFKTTL